MLELLVNIAGLLIAGLCTALLLRAYSRVKKRILLWSGFCFCGFTLSNALQIIDLQVFPGVNLYSWRLGLSAVSLVILLYGLILESD